MLDIVNPRHVLLVLGGLIAMGCSQPADDPIDARVIDADPPDADPNAPLPFPHALCEEPDPQLPVSVTVTPDVIQNAADIVGAGATPSGRSLWVNRDAEFFERSAAGQWRRLGDYPEVAGAVNGMLIKGETGYIYGGDGGSGFITEIDAEGTVRNHYHPFQLTGLFKRPDGTILTARPYQPYTLYELDEETLALTELTDTGRVMPIWMFGFDEYGFRGYCDDLDSAGIGTCIGSDEHDAVLVDDTLPQALLDTLPAEFIARFLRGTRPDSVWWDRHHFDGSAWTVEGLAELVDPRQILAVDRDRALLISESQIYYLDGRCWQPVLEADATIPYESPVFVFAPPNHLIWLSAYDDAAELAIP